MIKMLNREILFRLISAQVLVGLSEHQVSLSDFYVGPSRNIIGMFEPIIGPNEFLHIF